MKAGCCAGCPVMSNWSEGCQPFEQVRTESCGCLCALNEDVSVYHPPTLHLSLSLSLSLYCPAFVYCTMTVEPQKVRAENMLYL